MRPRSWSCRCSVSRQQRRRGKGFLTGPLIMTPRPGSEGNTWSGSMVAVLTLASSWAMCSSIFTDWKTRIIVDHLDHDTVIAELLRLLSVYGSKSRSFFNYGTRSFGSRPRCMLHLGPLQHPPFTRWSTPPQMESYNTKVHASRCGGGRVDGVSTGLSSRTPPTRRRFAKQHGGSPAPEKLQELYLKRMETSFPDGFVPKIGPRPGTIEYRPASGTLPHRSVHWIQSRSGLTSALKDPS